MKTRVLYTILFLLLTAVVAVFAFPATSINIFGYKRAWDGLNLRTLTDGKYEGELQFGKALDLSGGTKYQFVADLSQIQAKESEDMNYKVEAETLAQNFTQRLKNYGYQDFNVSWWLEGEKQVYLTLKISEHFVEDLEIIQLLASEGQIQFWTQDPSFNPQETDLQNSTVFTGMQQLDVSSRDVVSVRSVYSPKAGGYGFKAVFDPQTRSQFMTLNQTETYRYTMLTVDGDPVASRYAPIENLDGGEDSKPVVYFNSLLAQNFRLNDTLQSVASTGELKTNINLVSSTEIAPTLGENYVDNLKLSLVLMFGFLVIIIGYRHRWMGLYTILKVLVVVVWGLGLMKLLGAKLSLSLVMGFVLGILYVVLLSFTLVRNIDYSQKQKQIQEDIRQKTKKYRIFHFVVLSLIFFTGLVSVFHLEQLITGLGVIVLVNLFLMYFFQKPVFPLFISIQKKYGAEE